MKKNDFIYKFLRIICSPFFKFYYNPLIINSDVIPKKGAFIICGNHSHFMDQFPVIISTKRVIHWLSKKEYFESKFAFFFKSVGCISVDRNKHDGKSKEKAIKYLKKGEAIGLFPEGTRNKTNKELLNFKKGAVKMAKQTAVPIIPFAITGNFCFKSNNLIIRFGEPFYVKKNDDIDVANNKLKNIILDLKKGNLA